MPSLKKLLHVPLDLERVTQGLKLREGSTILGLAPIANSKQHGVLVLQPDGGEYRTRVFIQHVSNQYIDDAEYVGSYGGNLQTLHVFAQRERKAMTNIRFRHFKGGTYQLVCLAQDTADAKRTVVVYQSEVDGVFWMRDSKEFHEQVMWPDNVMRPRFRLISTEGDD